ncbi:MAG: hypothetical protein EOO89_14590 [Pedobacter sp.]|nr:MAG: hypothetical protein EOO89_14590 [Pedobacter sp.]
MLHDTTELQKLLKKLDGPYKKDDLITMFDIEKVFNRMRAAAILHMNNDKPESINYRKDYALWAEELTLKINLDLQLYTNEKIADERLTYYATVSLIWGR